MVARILNVKVVQWAAVSKSVHAAKRLLKRFYKSHKGSEGLLCKAPERCQGPSNY